jgi:hypothetical protein
MVKKIHCKADFVKKLVPPLKLQRHAVVSQEDDISLPTYLALPAYWFGRLPYSRVDGGQ